MTCVAFWRSPCAKGGLPLGIWDRTLLILRPWQHIDLYRGSLIKLGTSFALPVLVIVCLHVSVNIESIRIAVAVPVNLLLVLQTGAQLFTGNTATLSSAFFEGKVTAKDVGRSWGLSYMGNIIGCGLFALMTAYTGLLSYGTAELAIGTVLKKCSGAFFPTVVKAILCNWLVCLAVFLSTQANDLAGKMVGIWFPISTFVAIGLEHSVANMFLLPLGLLGGAELSITDVIVKNLIPVTIGNAIAGAIVVGAGYSYAFGKLGESD